MKFNEFMQYAFFAAGMFGLGCLWYIVLIMKGGGL